MSNVVGQPSPHSGGRRRRPNGSGSVSLRADGAYDVRISLPGGRRRRIVRRRPGETKAAHRRRAEAAVGVLQEEATGGHVVPSGHVTVERYADVWIERQEALTAVGRGLAPSTVSFYRQQFKYYVTPHLGSRPLPEVTTADVERMMDALTADGRSKRTVQAARNALGRLLREAKRDGLVASIATDGASRVRRVATEDPTSKALDPESLRKLFEAAAGSRSEPLLAALALLGLRRGEALGLVWDDVDLDAGVVLIRRSLSRVSGVDGTRLALSHTKTAGSRRHLPMPTLLVSLLRSWRVAQGRERLAAGPCWGGSWHDEDFVFTSPTGAPVDPANLRHALERLGRASGVGHVYPHQLRHSVASVLIDSGHTPPEVARVLGHSTPAVTMQYYAHAFERSTVEAVDAVAAAIGHRVSASSSQQGSGSL